MRVFKPAPLLDPVLRLQRLRSDLRARKQKDGGGTLVAAEQYAEVIELIRTVKRLCEQHGFKNAEDHADLTLTDLEPETEPDDVSTVLAAAERVHDALHLEVWRHTFLLVRAERKTYLDNDNLFSEAVAKAFPSALPDIRDAGNCLAAECGTASVFHLMRVAEWGLRALAMDLGLLRVRRGKKAGRAQHVSLPYSDWEHILNQLSAKVDAKLAKLRPGKRKQDLQEFYYPALQDIRGMRDAWRNHVMHTRRDYSVTEAEAIKEHIERLMKMLTTRVSEA